MPGGDWGEIAWRSVSLNSKNFLAVAWGSNIRPIFLGKVSVIWGYLESFLFPVEDKDSSFMIFLCAEATTEAKTPDSFNPCIMTYRQKKFKKVDSRVDSPQSLTQIFFDLTMGVYMRVNMPFLISFRISVLSVQTTCSRYLIQEKNLSKFSIRKKGTFRMMSSSFSFKAVHS